MKGAMNKILGAAAMAVMTVACSSSDDKDVAGGASGDMGFVANVITGDAQKGPFVKGSAVTVQGIDCKTLQLTDERFEGEVNSDKGDFSVKDVSLKSTCALFEVTGLYRSEITGKTSSKELTLRALTDLKDRESVNINILTNLEYERLVHLVTEKGKTFAEAKAQAEQEVLAAFDIAGSFEEFENLNIFESGDGNAALLAVSVMMQAKTDDAGLAKRIEKFEDSFAETGMWKDSAAKATISDWAAGAIAGNGLDSIRKNIETWDIGDTVAAFEKYITAEFPDTLILSSASREGSSSSSKDVVLSGDSHEGSSSSFANANDGSEYDATANTLKDLRDGKVYKTVKLGTYVWMAENLNLETEKSYCYKDSAKYCDNYGRLYLWSAVMDSAGLFSTNGKGCGNGKTCSPSFPVRGICPSGWHVPADKEWSDLTHFVGDSLAGKKLKSTTGWSATERGTDEYGFTALPAGYRREGSEMGANLNWSTYFWLPREGDSNDAAEKTDAVCFAWNDSRHADEHAEKTYAFSVRCVKDNFDWTKSKDVYLNPDINYDTIVDNRDGKVYKTVKIGNQVWMAENLDYADSARRSLSPSDGSWCFDDDEAKCKVTGRIYTWGALKDVCPDSWHLPNAEDWNTLFETVGGTSVAGKKLMSSMGWTVEGMSTNDYGFSALPAGYANSIGEGVCTGFWADATNDEGAVGSVLMDSGYENAGLYYSLDYMYFAYSVRCVKD